MGCYVWFGAPSDVENVVNRVDATVLERKVIESEMAAIGYSRSVHKLKLKRRRRTRCEQWLVNV